jgi:hypothetical protein
LVEAEDERVEWVAHHGPSIYQQLPRHMVRRACGPGVAPRCMATIVTA